MKNFSLSTFLGLCTLGVCLLLGLILSGWIIAQELPDTPRIPNGLAVQLIGQEDTDYGDYLSMRQAASYLCVREVDIQALIESGALEGVYTTIDGDDVSYYIFSKAALQQWIEKHFEEVQP